MAVNPHALYGSHNDKGTSATLPSEAVSALSGVYPFVAPPALPPQCDLFGPQIARHDFPMSRAVQSGAVSLTAPAYTVPMLNGPASSIDALNPNMNSMTQLQNADSVSCFNDAWALPSDAGSHYGLNLHSLQQHQQQQQQQQHGMDWQSLIGTMPYIQAQPRANTTSSEENNSNTSTNSSTFASGSGSGNIAIELPPSLPSGCPFFKMMNLDTHTVHTNYSTLPPLPTTPQPPQTSPPKSQQYAKPKKSTNKRRLRELDMDDTPLKSEVEYPMVGVQAKGVIRLSKHFFTAHDNDIHREMATAIVSAGLRRIAEHRWLSTQCVQLNQATYALTLSEDIALPAAMDLRPKKAKRGRPHKHKKRRVEASVEGGEGEGDGGVKAWNLKSGSDKVYKVEFGVVFGYKVDEEARKEMATCMLVDLNRSSLSMLFAHVVGAEVEVMGDVEAHKMYAVDAVELREYEQYERDEEERKRKKREREQRRRESKKKEKEKRLSGGD